ncbi:hypothetical protein [Burkholderia vietnamiensis]|uniref:hypothetical protein n=1 Tax=Burkholderia vietnamiensis TaxID=60552 RepID=UPI00352DC686
MTVTNVKAGPGNGAGYSFGPITQVVFNSQQSSYNVTNNDVLVECDCSSANAAVVLPGAAQSQGQYKMIKRQDATFAAGNAVTITDASGANIEGAASQTLNAQNSIIELRSDGTQWQVIGGSNSAAWGHVGAIANVPPGASPYTYTAQAAGSVVITGGTVSAVQLKRGTTTITIASASPAVVPVSAGDQVITTYSAAPTMSFVPR